MNPPNGIDLLLAGELGTYLADLCRLGRVIPERGTKGQLVWIRRDGSRS